MVDVKDKVVIVTGGGTGIGRGITGAFVKNGATVVISGRRPGPLEEVREAFPGQVIPVQADVTSSDGRKKLIAVTVEEFGRLDVLVNNAAIAPMASLADTTDEMLESACLTNLVAPALLIREALDALGASNGCVVNITTVAAHSTMPGYSAYISSKAGLNQLTRVLAAELGPLGIRVNAVAPGATRTTMLDGVIDGMGEDTIIGMTPLGRIGEPEDIAQAVLYLAGRDAGWVTGQIVGASGGFLI